MALKKTSQTIAISFSLTESAANTFTNEQISLPMDPLNNEVFVVQMLDIDPQSPENVAGTSTAVDVTVSTVSRTSVGSLADPNVLGIARRGISQGAGTVDGAAFSSDLPVAAAPQMDYLGIIATDDFFINIIGTNNTAAKTCQGRLYGYRAKADAATYAALVQSELLS